MSQFESGSACLEVCPGCPNNIDNQQDYAVFTIGEAVVTFNETTVRAVFAREDETGDLSVTAIEEQATQTINDDPRIYRIFKNCKNGAAQGLFERFGLKPMTGECPAARLMFDGDPTDADVVADYIETRTTDF